MSVKALYDYDFPSMDRAEVFDDDVIIYARTEGPRLPITSAAGLSRQFRRALMSVADSPVHELLSGHRPDGAPSESVHVAVFPSSADLARFGLNVHGLSLAQVMVVARAGRDDAGQAGDEGLL